MTANYMTAAFKVFQKLESEVESGGQREHVLETASRHVSNADERFNQQFDLILKDLTPEWGLPVFNSSTTDLESTKGIPPWSAGTPKNGGESKTVRLSYWLQPEGYKFVAFRTEVDPQKNYRPLYYELVVGIKKKKITDTIKTERLRNTEESKFAKIRGFFNWFIGR